MGSYAAAVDYFRHAAGRRMYASASRASVGDPVKTATRCRFHVGLRELMGCLSPRPLDFALGNIFPVQGKYLLRPGDLICNTLPRRLRAAPKLKIL
jgi:hypothetical protein